MDGELEDSALTNGAARDDGDLLSVLNRSDGTGSEQNLLVSLVQVDEVGSISLALEDVCGHLPVHVLGTNVRVGQKQLGDVLVSRTRGERGEGRKMNGLPKTQTSSVAVRS